MFLYVVVNEQWDKKKPTTNKKTLQSGATSQQGVGGRAEQTWLHGEDDEGAGQDPGGVIPRDGPHAVGADHAVDRVQGTTRGVGTDHHYPCSCYDSKVAAVK